MNKPEVPLETIERMVDALLESRKVQFFWGEDAKRIARKYEFYRSQQDKYSVETADRQACIDVIQDILNT